MKPKIQRHGEILSLVRRHQFMSVDELAAALDVTPQTIRCDIRELEEGGSLKRHHGGASSGGNLPEGLPADRQTRCQNEKRHCPADCGTHPRRFVAVRQYRYDHGSRGIRAGEAAQQPADYYQQYPRRLRRFGTYGLHGHHHIRRRPPFGRRYYRRGDRRLYQPVQSRLCRDEHARRGKRRFAFGLRLQGSQRHAGDDCQRARPLLRCRSYSKFRSNALVRLGGITAFDKVFTDRLPDTAMQKMLKEAGWNA